MVSTKEPVDAILGLTGLYARMTNSFVISGGINAVELALEDRLREIYEKHNGKPKIK